MRFPTGHVARRRNAFLLLGLVLVVVGAVFALPKPAPVAALVSLADYRQLKRLDAQIAERLRVVAEIQELFSDVPPDELEREISKAVAEVRAEMKAEREAARRS